MAFTTDDVPIAMVRQILEWTTDGRPSVVSGVDLEACLAGARAPLHLIVGAADRVALPSSATIAAEAWGGTSDVCEVPGFGHLDLLYGHTVADDVHAPVLRWLAPRRRRSWGLADDEPAATSVA